MKFRTLSLTLIAGFCLAFTATAAQASPTNLPAKFDASKHVRVDPALKKKPGFEVQVSSLEPKILAAGQAQHLNVYEVFLLKGTEKVEGKFGPAKANELYELWKKQPGFPSQNFLLIVVVRDNVNPKLWSVGCELGSGPKGLIGTNGLTAAVQDEFGALKATGDYNAFSVALVKNVSNRIFKAAVTQPKPQPTNPQPQPTRPQPQPQPGPVASNNGGGHGGLIVLLVIGGLVVVGGGIGIAVYMSSQKKKLQAELAQPIKDWNNYKNTIRPSLDGLARKFPAGMINGDWKFAGISEDQYKAAVSQVAQANAQASLADAQDADIQALIAGGKLRQLKGKLTEQTVGNTNQTAVQLAAGVEAHVNAASSGFQKLWDAIGNAKANADSIRAKVKTIDASRAALEATGLSFAPYQGEYDTIEGGIEEFLKQVNGDQANGVYGDPMGGEAQSAAELQKVSALNETIGKAVALKGELPGVEKTVAAATERTATLRKTNVEYKLAGKHTGPATYSLTEEGGNPDASLANAAKRVAEMSAALNDGKVPAAEQAKADALAAAGHANQIVDNVLAAQKRVENEAPSLQAQLGAQSNGFDKLLAVYGAGNFLAAAAGLAAFGWRVSLRTKRVAVNTSLTNNRDLVTDNTVETVNAAVAAATKFEAEFAQPQLVFSTLEANGKSYDAGLNSAQAAIDADVEAARKGAAEAVAALGSACDNASATINDPVVSQGPKSVLATAEAVLASLKRDLQSTKPAYRSIHTRADSERVAVEQAHVNAEAEIAQAHAQADLTAARASLLTYAARRYVVPVNGYYYGQNILCDTSAALAHQTNAELYFQSGQYDLMEAELAAMRQAQYDADLYAWYLTMQLMADSQDRMAQRYAYDMGFANGMAFDAWQQQRVAGGYNYQDNWNPTPVDQWTPSPEPQPTNGGVDFNNSGSAGDGNTGWTPNTDPDTGYQVNDNPSNDTPAQDDWSPSDDSSSNDTGSSWEPDSTPDTSDTSDYGAGGDGDF